MSKKSDKRLKHPRTTSTKDKRSCAVSEKVEGTPVEHSGVVHRFRENRHRDFDGLILADETIIRFPAHIGKTIESKILPGDQILVIGTHHETSKGEWQLRASYIECLRSEFTIDIDVDPAANPSHPHPVQQAAQRPAPSCREILEEIKSICTLLQDRILVGSADDPSANDQLLKALRRVRRGLQAD